ncbi:MAG: hypothetical protein EAZ97_02115 [Bacteroidetes bacterium]|nr:MAG: hypothetical protein EAZ97_02115 [Bacteroidota bacterium]
MSIYAFAVGTESQQVQTPAKLTNAEMKAKIDEQLAQENISWKEKTALKMLKRKVEKAEKRGTESNIKGFAYTLGVILVVLGIIGLLIPKFGIVGGSSIVLGIVLILLAQFIL